MSYQLKDLYSTEFYERFCRVIKQVLPKFDEDSFTQLIFDKNWTLRELKDRMKHTSKVLHQFLPSNFDEAGDSIIQLVKALEKDDFTHAALEFMFLPDYVEFYGIEHLDKAVDVFEKITHFTSCEFAVRPFIVKYEKEMMEQMHSWSKHENKHVRRLASEGSRPRLPWAMALPSFKKDPTLILPILENLKADESEYVRRSVANNLNDISKDNPEITFKISKKWKGKSTDTDKLVKHACRSLLKEGIPKVMQLFGYSSPDEIDLQHFKVESPTVNFGENLLFSFQLQNTQEKVLLVRIEYGIYFKKASGRLARKVFKISEKKIPALGVFDCSKSHSIHPISTRKYYAGGQELSVIINGEEKVKGVFDLRM